MYNHGKSIAHIPTCTCSTCTGDESVFAAGTLDCTGLEVESEDSLRELTQASGANLGGEMVNGRFVELVRRVVGEELVKKIKRESPQAWFEFVQYFEQAKKVVKAGEGKGVTVSIPYEMCEHIKSRIQQINANTTEHGVQITNGRLVISNVIKFLCSCTYMYMYVYMYKIK